ncbi:MAG: bifunctional (p)ppGpp synthetase/guanosine-3',5'-bis(diphosphate) 3'-pyrophosphohydrolase [Christensenellaceae bacterium]|jgi:GTP pyrophosphokinase|nr:bifunctional (p)ppGpp synthetase/guanosine-3',5'-bis(diphosphate) 3'-pyrophosphohydrolase [Christensenellaceae bacterium]
MDEVVRTFLTKCSSIYDENDCQLIKYAIDFAIEKHNGQLRKSGEPYVIHPLAVADILTDLRMDAVCITAALLHDVLEDTDCDESEFKKKFGNAVFALVSGVTKLSGFQYMAAEDTQMENYRRLFFAAVNDMRVIFIKLADRLHNMRTLAHMPKDKQERIAKETLEIYAPMASRLGLANIKSELEDLSMKYLYPLDYANLSGIIEKTRGERMGFVMRIASEIEVALTELKIQGEVKGRPKHLYSIFKKMSKQGKTLEQIYDLIAVRVIVETIADCYTILGIIHSKWKPIPGRFKDYIAMPKPNKYQSLHTTVVTQFGQIFEIQIRTYEMNKTAEYGIAAHWIYKEKGSVQQNSDFDSKLGWVREVIEMEEGVTDSREYISNIKLNIVNDDIYVFTPKGAVLNLPAKSTCVDFAYKVHSAIGNKCVGAKINSKMVPLSTTLENGDVVEILTSSTAKGPSRDWLKFVITAQAKSRIRAFLKKELLTENIKAGKDMLERESKKNGYSLAELLEVKSAKESIFSRHNLTSNEDLFASVGNGVLTTRQIIFKLIDAHKKEVILNNPEALLEQYNQKDLKKIKNKRPSGVIVEGYDDFLIKFAKCCNPVPGDSIVGYASRGTGVSIHRSDCTNIKNMETERMMKCDWSASDLSTFVAQFKLECMNKVGVLNEIVSMLSQQGYSITSMDLHVKNTHKDSIGKANIALGVEIKNSLDVEYIIKKFQSMNNIITVSRNG